MEAILYLEDGTYYKGKGFGHVGTSFGELVFNTSMTGYQEILTDPSYAGQVIALTYPLIGNYGVNEKFSESYKSFSRGLVVKSISNTPSNYMSMQGIDDMLKSMEVVGIYDVDTRSITRKIRNSGSLKCIISSKAQSKESLLEELSKILNQKYERLDEYFKDIKGEKEDFMKNAGTKSVYKIEGKGKKVAVLDFGVKKNILRNLSERGCGITVFPYSSSADDILSIKPDGVLLSNGPGDPKCAVEAIETVKNLIGKTPIFGICMGHQILSLAFGADTYKLKYGHRGGNHGVKDLYKDRCYITSQNHGFAVDEKSLKDTELLITHINLNDGTVEGLKHKYYPIFSVQFHPEGAPGPKDSEYLFDEFMYLMEEGKNE
ncbi:carbamoyl-phosphate synthase small subunit [Caloramator quimbayensis]|uniref:Carbamoyl phosphate synthase small chain n=1 Tax=Caloramator quimbayensis TaxID=1147123 RepID=A0A1T4WLZ1_9CLOT|nr:glutamine-hydrolyzing carbamoyl-phosphate synthase small subunit [Caloramator quimbayensis]SKA78353.1 carbamoyl-phosphate synthase small subunit [Caloramator quimbayensis]